MSETSDFEITETEAELLAKAQLAVSRCNWVVGECAAKWTTKYAKGRTDADFGLQVGLSADQVYQRRRVWDTFGDIFESYLSLKWSHFYVALTWDDAPECFQWAEENEATVAETKVWRRAQHGEDLAEESPQDEWGIEAAVSFLPTDRTPVREPAPFDGGTVPRIGTREGATAEVAETVSGVARESEDSAGEYSPYRKGAGSPPPKEEAAEVAVIERPQPSSEQLAKRIAASLERINKALTPEMLTSFRDLPEPLRNRFVKSVSELSSKTAGLL